MGYDTNFAGSFKVTPLLEEKHAAYVNQFSETRRMKRYPDIAVNMEDPLREAVGLPIGEEAEYFVGGLGPFGQSRDVSIEEYNTPPSSQPGLWCQWVCESSGSEDHSLVSWDRGEKFYEYVEWLEYLVERFFAPWGYKLNGEVRYFGEDDEDRGTIIVIDNEVTTRAALTIW